MKIRNLKSKIWKLKKLEIPKIFKIFDKLKSVNLKLKNSEFLKEWRILIYDFLLWLLYRKLKKKK